MSAISEDDRAFFSREYDRLSGDLMSYYQSIVQTERLAIAGAAGVVAFLYTGLPVFAGDQSEVLSALPAAIVILAALRCLSIYLVMTEVAAYLRRVEGTLTAQADFGFQRCFGRAGGLQMRLIETTTTALWVLATCVTLYFWWVYVPPAPSS
ncbi:MAG: hypothetical protein AAGE18_14150 [Pseudomonadota bacterium]